MRKCIDNAFKADKDHFKLHAVLTYVVLSIGYAIVTFHKSATSVLTSEMAESYNCSESDLTIFSSMYFWMYAAMQPFTGVVADIFDASLIILVGAAISSIGALITGLTSSFSFSLFGRFLVGLGTSPIYVCICKLLTAWYPMDKYAVLTGGIWAASGIGSIAATSSLDWVAATFGWKMGFIAIAIFGALFTILALFFVRDCPERLGYPAVNEYNSKTESSTWGQTLSKLKSNLYEVFSKRQVYLLSLFKFSLNGFYNSFASLWGGAYVEDVFPNYNTGNILTSLSISMIVGSLALPFIARYFKSKRWILIICSILTTANSIVFVFFDKKLNFYSLYALLFIWSLFAGPTATLVNSLLALAYSHEANATAIGIANVFPSLGCAIFQHLIDHFLSQTERVNGAFSHEAYSLGLWIPSAVSAFIALFGPLFSAEVSASSIKKPEEVDEDEHSGGNYNKVL